MTTSKQNPKAEWGYYAMTPRIVRTQYKQLSHTEKWLYVCLKDLCGDRGTCYRTLKVLSQETDLSTGNLSTGIRNLHAAGLIHAEKKRRSTNPTAKEVWHITIVDIWQANVEERSNFECPDDNVQILNNNVQDLNHNVQNMNEPSPKRSKFEAKRSNFVDRSNNTEEEHTEVITSEEGSCASPIVDAEPSAFSDDDDTVKAPVIPKTPTTPKPAQDIPPVVEAVPEQAAPGNDENETLPQQQTLVAPAASKPRARQAKKAVEPEPTPDELALQVRCKTWYDRVTDWCGGPMTKGGQVINEHRSIKLACQKYTDSQLEAIFKYVTTRDWKYSKIDNKYTVRCYVLWDESGRVAQILKEERQSGQCTPPASNAPRFAANMPANLGNEPLVVWKPPTKTKQPVTARGR